MAEHPIQGLMGVTIEKIRDMVNAETIIGDPIHVDDTTIIPVSRVTFGFVSGGSDVGPSSNKQMFGGGSGAGVSVTPVAFLVVSNGNVRTVQLVEKVSAVDNVIASLPELVDKVAALIKKEKPGADAPGHLLPPRGRAPDRCGQGQGQRPPGHPGRQDGPRL